MDEWQPTDAELYHAFVDTRVSRSKIASMSLDSATHMVEYRRKRKVAREYRDLSMSDQAIAQAILNYARGVTARVMCPTCNAPNPRADNFCGKCGASLEAAKVAPVARSKPPRRPIPSEKPSKPSAGRALLILGAVLVGGIVLICAVLMIVSQLTAPDEAERTAIAATRAALPTQTPGPTATPTMTIAELKASATLLTYAELARNTENHVGKLVYFQGNVVQVMEGFGDRADLRVYVTQDEYGFWDDAVLVHYEGPRLLEDDIVQMWCEVEGRITYETILGAKITVPELTAVILDREE